MKNLNKLLEDFETTIDELAVKTGIDISRLKEIIDRSTKPKLGELKGIATAFGISLRALLADDSVKDDVTVLFRRTFEQYLQRPVEKQIESAISAISSTAYLKSREVQKYDWSTLFNDIAGSSYQDAYRAATLFRRHFYGDDQVSPILSLPTILSNHLDVSIFIVSGNDFEGASTVYQGQKYVFLSPRFKGRMLFTLAHELGHLVCHHSEERFLAYDKDIFEMASNITARKEETFANNFASRLLMPEAGVGVALNKVRQKIQAQGEYLGDIEILYLSRIYGVSFLAAALRCEQLELIPSGGAVALDSKLKKEHGSAEKRAKELGLPDRPPIDFVTSQEKLLDLAIEKINAKELSIGRATELLNVGLDNFYAANTKAIH